MRGSTDCRVSRTIMVTMVTMVIMVTMVTMLTMLTMLEGGMRVRTPTECRVSCKC